MALATEGGTESAGYWQATTPEAAASAVVDALRHSVAVLQTASHTVFKVFTRVQLFRKQ